MTPRILVGGVIAALTQIGVFIAAWEVAVRIARSLGRFPPGLKFEFSFEAALVAYSLFVLLTTTAAVFLKEIKESLLVTAGCVFVWFLWLASAISERPISLPVFFLMGGTIMVVFSGIMLPFWSSLEYRRRLEQTKTAEQAVPPKSDRAGG